MFARARVNKFPKGGLNIEQFADRPVTKCGISCPLPTSNFIFITCANPLRKLPIFLEIIVAYKTTCILQLCRLGSFSALGLITHLALIPTPSGDRAKVRIVPSWRTLIVKPTVIIPAIGETG